MSQSSLGNTDGEGQIGGKVPLTHDGMSNIKGRKIPDHIPELLPRALTAHTVGYETFSNTGDARAPQTVVRGTGPSLSAVNLTLIFWGQEWTTSSPASPVDPNALEIAVRNICNGPYLEAAYRYGNFGNVSVGSVVRTNSPTAPPSFNTPSITGLLTSLLNSDTVAPPPDPPATGDALPTSFYAVMLPSTSSYGPGGLNGLHSYFDWTNPVSPTSPAKRIYFAWVLNNGILDFMTSVFSHELAEAYTDPEGTFIQIAPANSSNWNEVADICRSAAYLDGVLVQSYWSQAQNACVLPFYNFSDVVDNLPTGVDFQVIAIRRAWSRERHSFFIQKIKVQDPVTSNTFQIFTSNAVDLIENGKNTFFVIGTDGVRANVIVVPVHAHFVLSTVPDASTANNLLALPAF
jgi:hypothetical protein